MGPPSLSAGPAAVALPPAVRKPRLRGDLVFRPRRTRGKTIFIVEDPLRSKFFRLGEAEYEVVAGWDGHADLADTATDRLGAADALALAQWASENRLLDAAGSGSPAPPAPPRTGITNRWSRWNPILFRIPLLHPEKLIARADRYAGWIFSWWATFIALALAIVAVICLVTQWHHFVSTSTASIFTPSGQVALVGCWIALKLAHELAHGLVCRRYGGETREAGLVMILFLPIAYIDVTSTWRLRSKWQRIHIAAAGMQLELYLAAAAALVWSVTAPGVLNQSCANLMIMASVTTVFFNANPLMRFDGYYILTDLLEAPNLYTNSQQWLKRLTRRVFFGIAADARAPVSDAYWIRAYGLAAFIWRIIVCASLVVAAAAMWHGAGIVLSVVAIVGWLAPPTAQLLRQLAGRGAGPQPSWRRFAAVTIGSGSLAAALLWSIPWPGATRAAGIVTYDALDTVRAPAAGFVRQVLVASGQSVEAGQLLAIVESDELNQQHANLLLRLDASRLRSRGYRHRHEMAALESEHEEWLALETQRQQLAEQLAGLELRASRSGRVVTRHVDELVGQYVGEGEELLAIGDESQKCIECLVRQDDLERFRRASGSQVSVYFSAGGKMRCELGPIQPRGSRVPSATAFFVPFGGPLSARQAERTGEVAGESRSTWELLTPHFSGVVELDPTSSRQVRSGQRATVALDGERDSIGGILTRRLHAFLRGATHDGGS